MRCVEAVHGSVEEGLTQPAIASVRQIVGATQDELDWLGACTEQRFVALHPADPAIGEARRQRAALGVADRIRCAAYFPTYTTFIFGGSTEERDREDAIVRQLIRATPGIRWFIKPHPADSSAARRFAWLADYDAAQLVPAASDALTLLTKVDLAVHCGSSLDRWISDLGIPQIEIAPSARALSTNPPPGTIVVRDAEEALRVVDQPPRVSPRGVTLQRGELRDLVLGDGANPAATRLRGG